MAGSASFTIYLTGALLAYALYAFGPMAQRTLTVLGVLRWNPARSLGLDEVVVIPDTINCEDLHYHAPSGTLFTACEDNVDERLIFENFDGPFITHGIDVISDPERANDAVYIFAVNHVADPELPRARSQIEVFYHVVRSPVISHVRSVWHPLIKTPNDIFASSPTSVYVTNDHHYRDHGIMRALEDMYYNANWTETVYLKFDLETTGDSVAAVEGSVALDHIHNNNGLGHGRSPNEILVVSCTGGIAYIGQIGRDNNITLIDSIAVDSIIDNPTYFDDPFARSSGVDHSGFLLPGLTRAVDLAGNSRNPEASDASMVWFSQPKTGEPPSRWETRLLFEDDGSRIRTASAAVLVAIDPRSDKTDGHETRKAWLFVTGFQSKNMIAVKVDL